MKRAKKRKRNLESRIKDWEQTVGNKPELKKQYRKPGSNQ